MRQAAPQSKLKSSDKLKIPWEKIRNLNEFQFHECLCACFKLSFQSTVKNCINKSIRCWVCNCCYSDPVVGAVVVFVVAVAMSQSNTLYLISLRTFFSFCWHSTRTPERDKQWERESECERERKVCVHRVGGWKWRQGTMRSFLLLFIHVSVWVCVCVRVYTIKHWCQNLICCINRFEPLTHSCVRFIFVETATATDTATVAHTHTYTQTFTHTQ